MVWRKPGRLRLIRCINAPGKILHQIVRRRPNMRSQHMFLHRVRRVAIHFEVEIATSIVKWLDQDKSLIKYDKAHGFMQP